jgi:hypothetical protein
MNSFKNPLTPQITTPVNLDRPIQDLQAAFAAFLPWLTKSFGRAYPGMKSGQGSFGAKKTLVYPQVWQGVGLDLLEVLPNDNVISQSFFKVEDPIETLEYVPDGYSIMRARVSIIFWFNLKRIDDEKNYNFTELLKGQAQRVITKASLSYPASVKILRIFEGAAQVFAGYDLSLLKDQELVYPYGGFRFETEITYAEDCPEVTL